MNGWLQKSNLKVVRWFVIFNSFINLNLFAMYTLKTYFFVIAEAMQNLLHKYPSLQESNAVILNENGLQRLVALELPHEDISSLENLCEEFSGKVCKMWRDPTEVDFSVALPEKNCNSFVLPVYGNFRDACAWAENWQKASRKETQQVHPVMIVCYRTPQASWVELRGHTENPHAGWFDDICKICKNFTKSRPTFYYAEKM